MLTINCFIIPSALEFCVINTNIFSSVESIGTCYNECFMLSLEDNRKTDRLRNDGSSFCSNLSHYGSCRLAVQAALCSLHSSMAFTAPCNFASSPMTVTAGQQTRAQLFQGVGRLGPIRASCKGALGPHKKETLRVALLVLRREDNVSSQQQKDGDLMAYSWRNGSGMGLAKQEEAWLWAASWRNRKLPHCVVSSRLRRVKGSLRVHRNSTQHCPREGFPKEGKINWNIISKKELARRRIGEREGSGRVETLCKSSKLWGIKKTNPLPIQILAKSMWGREVFLYITYLRNICYI